MRVLLGNRDAFNVVNVPDGKGGITTERQRAAGNFRLDIDFPDGVGLSEAFANVTARNGIWANHTLGNDSKPAWVASDSAELASLIAAEYDCEVRELDEDSDGLPVLPEEGN